MINILEIYENILEVEFATRMWPDRTTVCDDAIAKCKKMIADNHPEVIQEHDKQEAIRMINLNCEHIAKIVDFYSDKYKETNDLIKHLFSKLNKEVLERE